MTTWFMDSPLKEVLYIPEVRDNLMSVEKLTTTGVQVHFDDMVAILKKDGEVIATAQLRLFKPEIDLKCPTVNLCKSKTDELWLWQLG